MSRDDSSSARLVRADAVGSELVKVVIFQTQFTRTVLAGLSLESSGLRILAQIAATGPLRVADLAAALFVDGSTMSRQVSALTASGHVASRPSAQDRRASLVGLTQLGEETFNKVRRRRAELLSSLLEGFEDAEIDALLGLLHRVTSGVDLPLEDYRPT